MKDKKAIQNKIKTVGNIKKITHAMELISRTKMQKAIQNVLSLRPFALYARELLVNLSKNRNLESPFLEHGAGGKELLVVIASDKGLCGGYNANIERALRQKDFEKTEVVCLGKKALSLAKKFNLKILEKYTELPDRPSVEFVEEISQKIRSLFLSGEYRFAEVVFTDYISSFSQKVRSRKILPITDSLLDKIISSASFSEEKEEKLNGEKDFLNYILEPDASSIFANIVPFLIDVSILHAMLEAKASEESMRMFAMKSATENANKMKAGLTLSFNRARQQSITQEIAEISAGADALA